MAHELGNARRKMITEVESLVQRRKDFRTPVDSLPAGCQKVSGTAQD